LSLGGRIVVLNSVLIDVPLYQMSLCRIPFKIRTRIVQLRKHFLWYEDNNTTTTTTKPLIPNKLG
jgi:hypothetical protein